MAWTEARIAAHKEIDSQQALTRGKVATCDYSDSPGGEGFAFMTTLLITGLHRDLRRKRSIVAIEWEDDPERSLALIVPFDCELENLNQETERAVRALATELESAIIRTARGRPIPSTIASI